MNNFSPVRLAAFVGVIAGGMLCSVQARTRSHSSPGSSARIIKNAAVAAVKTIEENRGPDSVHKSRATNMPAVRGLAAVALFHPVYQADMDSDVRVGVMFTSPTAYYDFDGKTLSWQQPPEHATLYMMAVAQDLVTGEFLPGCTVTAQCIGDKGHPVGTSVTLKETWDPRFSHYGENVSFPDGTSSVTINLTVEPPKERRRDLVLGNFFTKPVELKFQGVDVTTATAAKIAAEVMSANQTTASQEAASVAGSNSKARSEKYRLPKRADQQGGKPIDWPAGRRPYVEPTPYPGQHGDDK